MEKKEDKDLGKKGDKIVEKKEDKIVSKINDKNVEKKEDKNVSKNNDKNVEKKEDKNVSKINDKLKKRLQDRIELYTYQKMQIEEKQAKTKNLEKENNEQEILIKQRVFDNKNKLKEMENKYDALYRKVINCIILFTVQFILFILGIIMVKCASDDNEVNY